MIFVSLGTHERPFFRLAREMDRLSREGRIRDKIVAQLGFTDYKFKSPRIKAEKYMSQKKFDKSFKGAEIIITHGGSGNILDAISQGKPVVAVPRLSKFGEHVNDHQLQIVKEMEKLGNVFAVYDIEKLFEAIEKAKTAGAKKAKRNTPEIFGIIEKTLEKWERAKS
ncbi:MAG: beta-1,4-galactosyltransferase [Nanoarchaeota archaeon]|nr:beta-1,4-galactosyltransferase [Nanoarchaeota archaeon]